LVSEFNNIFNDLFLHNTNTYKHIVEALVSGAKEPSELAEALGKKLSGKLSEYMCELELAGFICRDYTWSIKTTEDSKLSKYRLSDNYLRFYLKYVSKNLSKIQRESFTFKTLTSLPAWDAVMGFQFENLVLNN